MSAEPDKYWEGNAKILRKLKGLLPLSLEEAEEALRRTQKRPASDEEVDSVAGAVLRGEIPEAEPEPQADWAPDFDYSGMEKDLLPLHRNQGEGCEEPDPIEEELRRELLNDDEPQDDDDALER